MKTAKTVALLRDLVVRLVADGVRDRADWFVWKAAPENVAFLAKCLQYKQEEGMPSPAHLIKPFFHPEFPLVGLNYTPVAHNTLHMFKNGWSAGLRLCRGIVFDHSGKLVAFPFPKFFNHGEMHAQRLPNESWEATEKMDGHLMIIFWYRNRLIGTTRGTFVFESSMLANELLQQREASWRGKMPQNVTLLAEFIHPRTHVHVDYGNDVRLCANGAFNNETFEDFDHTKLARLADSLGIPVVELWSGSTIEELVEHVKSAPFLNKEGFVVRFASGLRIKFKYMSYVALMIKDKLSLTYVMNQLVGGTYDKKMADFEGEVQMEADKFKQRLLETATISGTKKERWQRLYDLLDEEERAIAAEERRRSQRVVLNLLDKDIAAHPERLQPLPQELLARVEELVQGVEVDLDAPIAGPTALDGDASADEATGDGVETKSSTYKRGIARKFHKWLVETGQISEDLEPVKKAPKTKKAPAAKPIKTKLAGEGNTKPAAKKTRASPKRKSA